MLARQLTTRRRLDADSRFTLARQVTLKRPAAVLSLQKRSCRLLLSVQARHLIHMLLCDAIVLGASNATTQ
jgi:hypothetical protein